MQIPGKRPLTRKIQSKVRGRILHLAKPTGLKKRQGTELLLDYDKPTPPPVFINAGTRPLMDPKSKDPRVESLRRIGYCLSEMEVRRLTSEKNEIAKVNSARKGIVEFVRTKIAGGGIAASDLESAIHTTENFFVRTSTKLTKEALGKFKEMLSNFGEKDWRKILEKTPDYAEFTIFRKYLQMLIEKRPGKENDYERSRKYFTDKG